MDPCYAFRRAGARQDRTPRSELQPVWGLLGPLRRFLHSLWPNRRDRVQVLASLDLLQTSVVNRGGFPCRSLL